MPKLILFYRERDAYGYYSNFYKAKIIIGGITYFCNEQYIMYQKALLFNDRDIAQEILRTTNQATIKALGRRVKNFKEEIWVSQREAIADNCNYAKFTQHADLQKYLLETGDAILAEATVHDRIWGIGCDAETGKDQSKWNGLNILGQSLMRVRQRIRQVSSS